MIIGDYHGDEDEIDAEYRANREAYEEEHDCSACPSDLGGLYRIWRLVEWTQYKIS